MDILFQRPVSFTEAMVQLADRELLPTSMSAADLRQLGRDVRAQSIFSARTTHLGYLEKQKDVIDKMLKGEINIATGRAELQDELDRIGYTPEGGFPGDAPGTAPAAPRGSLQDLSSDRRLKLILETQTSRANNYALREQGMDDLARFQFPAWELVRIAHRDVPRDQMPGGLGWPQRFTMAGGQLRGGGRMVALKDDQVWSELGSSALFEDGLDSDVPPYAYNSGMGWREVSREECRELGLITGDEMPESTDARFFDETKVNADQFSEEELKALLDDLRPAA